MTVATNEIIQQLKTTGPIPVEVVRKSFNIKNVKSAFRNHKDIEIVSRVDPTGKSVQFLQLKTACKQDQVIKYFKEGNSLTSKQMQFFFGVPNPSALINDIRKKKGINIALKTKFSLNGKPTFQYEMVSTKTKTKAKSNKGSLVVAMDKLRSTNEKSVA